MLTIYTPSDPNSRRRQDPILRFPLFPPKTPLRKIFIAKFCGNFLKKSGLFFLRKSVNYHSNEAGICVKFEICQLNLGAKYILYVFQPLVRPNRCFLAGVFAPILAADRQIFPTRPATHFLNQPPPAEPAIHSAQILAEFPPNFHRDVRRKSKVSAGISTKSQGFHGFCKN